MTALTYLLVVSMTTAGLTSAQLPAPSATWAPWAGCWTVAADGAPGPAGASSAAGKRARVCVDATGDTATIATTAEGGSPMTQTIVADGQPRGWTDGDCTGTQSARWSADGHRLYTRAELSCPGGTRRLVSGLSLLAVDGSWLETQALTIGSRDTVRVRRFTRDGPVASPVPAPARRLTAEDVSDMASHVAAPAIEAALVETRSTFALTAARLLALEKAGVPPPLIDLMVALTFPQAYRVRAAQPADRISASLLDEDIGGAWGPWAFTSWVGGAAYYDSAYFLSPFGYSYLGSYPLFSGVAIGNARSGRGDRERGNVADEGRVVNGLGYTRLVPRRDAEPTNASSASGGGTANTQDRGSVTTRGYTRGSDSSGGASSVPAASGAAPAGSGGSSSAGGSTDTGRTAVPR